jgi:hypothetical protein
VLARSAERITAAPAIEHFGIGHSTLRELGGGWQLLETGPSASYRVDFPAGARAWMQATGDALLAVDVTDMCASILAVAPTAEDVAVHMPNPIEKCRDMQHVHPMDQLPVEAAAATLAGWAERAGLTPDPAYLRWVLDPDSGEDEGLDAADRGFELVLALGIPAITPSLVRRIDPSAAPFRTITARIGGLAALAWAELRDGTPGEPMPGWVTDAVALEERIWRTAFAEEDVDTAGLVRDIGAVVAAHRGFRQETGPPAEQVIVGGRAVGSAHHLADTMYEMLSAGQLVSFAMADDRPQTHPIYRPPSAGTTVSTS